jgi:hypothetical protein
MAEKPTNEKRKIQENNTDRWQYGSQYYIHVMYFNILKYVYFFIKDATQLKTVSEQS